MEIIEVLRANMFIAIPTLLGVIILLWWFNKGIGGTEKNVAYIQKNDPTAQKVYDGNRKGDVKPLTLKERLELSWQFLYDITDIVLSKFSAADQEEALKIGKSLLENGGHYEHVIDYGIKHNLGSAQSKGGVTKGV